MKTWKKMAVWKKVLAFTLIAFGILAAGAAMFPSEALALGWSVNDMLTNTKVNGLNTNQFTQNNIVNLITRLSSWALGIAIVLFVGRIVATAIDRMVFGKEEGPGGGGPGGRGGHGRGGAQDESILERIGWPRTMPWKQVWLSFLKNVAIVVGAWILVQLAVNIVAWIAGQSETFINSSK